MGRALIHGLVASSEAVTVVERNAARREYWQSVEGVTLSDTAVAGDGVIVAVKPKDVGLAVSDAAGAGAPRILSVAAGVSLAKLHEFAGGRVPVIRAMPNIAAMVGKSATAVVGGSTAHSNDMEWARTVLGSVGLVVDVTEDQIDAVTGLSGSGPAYIFLVAEALADAGVAAGLPRTVAVQLANQTLSGAAALLGGDRSAAELRADVTTPAGTTAAGLTALERHAVRAAFSDAVSEASARSRQMGNPQLS